MKNKKIYHNRRFKPQNPSKYMGDHKNIVLRSSWEVKFAIWCDRKDFIKEWSSEEIIVPYVCPTDGKRHRYYVDFMIKVDKGNGRTKTYLVEVKPYNQTIPPVYPGRKTQKFIRDSFTYAKNQAKWESAKKLAEKRDWEFKLITEHELGV